MLRRHFGFSCLLLACAVPLLADEPVKPKITAEQRAKMRERSRLIAETRKLTAEGKVEEAIVVSEKVLAAERELQGHIDDRVADALRSLAHLYAQRGDLQAARRALDGALAIKTQLHGTGWRAVNARLDVRHFDLLAKLSRAQRLELKEAQETLAQAKKQENVGKYHEALEQARSAEAVYQRILGEKSLERGKALHQIGIILTSLGRLAEAEQTLREALAIHHAEVGEEYADVGLILNSLAIVHMELGDHAQAESLHLKAMKVRKEVFGERHREYGICLAYLAGVHEKRGDHEQAAALYRQALEIEKRLGVKNTYYADYLHLLGIVLATQRDLSQGERCLREALAIRKEVLGEHHLDLSKNLTALVHVLMLKNEYAEIEPLLRQAMLICKATVGENHRKYAYTLAMWGDYLVTRGDHRQAERHYREAIRIAKESVGDKHPFYADILERLASLLELSKDYVEAETLHRRALAIRKDIQGVKHFRYSETLYQLAYLYALQDDSARAFPLLLEAADRTKDALGEKHPAYAKMLVTLGTLHAQRNDDARAEACFRQAHEIMKETFGPDHHHCRETQLKLAASYAGRKDYAQARPLAQQALASAQRLLDLASTVRSERQQLQMVAELRLHFDMVSAISVLAKTFDYEPVLRWKGAVFAGQHRLALERNSPELAPLVADLRDTTSKLAALLFTAAKPDPRKPFHDQVSELTERKEQLEAELARQSALFRRNQELSRLTANGLREVMPPDVALVDIFEFAGSKSYLVAFVMRRDRNSGVVVILGNTTEIAEAIDQWRQTIATRTRPVMDANDPAVKLRQLIWEPIEKHVAGAKTVLISPDGPLHRLPFAALPGSNPDKFLIEEMPIVVIPVPQLLPQLLEERPADGKPSALILGDVDYGADAGRGDPTGSRGHAVVAPLTENASRLRWGRLPASGVEAAAVRDQFVARFPQGAVTHLRAGQATETAVRQQAGQHRYLHLATHGFFAHPQVRSALMPSSRLLKPGIGGHDGFLGHHPGLLCGLVLAGANQSLQANDDDGILTALEMGQLDLRSVDLAVLSACETGLGNVAGGEGVMGLQRSLQIAGARSVITSLWKVDDEATAALMSLFYHKLWQEKQTPLTALREAQLAIYHHPERIAGLAKERGPNFEKLAKLPVTPAAENKAVDNKSPVKQWAGFVLSGAWR